MDRASTPPWKRRGLLLSGALKKSISPTYAKVSLKSRGMLGLFLTVHS